MICGLDKAYSGNAPLGTPLECSLHELTPEHTVLGSRIHGDRSYTDDRRTFVQDIAANDATAQLGDDHVVSGMRQAFGKAGDCNVRSGKVRREAMLLRNRLESFIADRPAPLSVLRGT